MRIIGGTKRGTRLEAPPGMNIRPMPDMVRESLFNILGQDMTGVRFLDLFAGTGAVGLEAASRGAEACILVDVDREAADLCLRNVNRLGLGDRVSVLHMGALGAVEELASRGDRFDVVFAGPPYPMSLESLMELGRKIALSGIMAEEGLFVIQLPASMKGFEPQGFTLIREKRYGKNKLLFFNP
jgi:16S rRNA (guanine966-N2)-methyltransferase